MPVICPVCETENRDAANFCHGCARKLPGFAATGPSLLDGIRPTRSTVVGVPAGEGPGAANLNAPRAFWIGMGALMLAAAVGFGGWFAYVTRRVPAPVPGAAPVAVTPRPAPLDAPRPSAPVPLGSSLGAGEAAVSAEPPAIPPAAHAQTPAPKPAPAPMPEASIQRRPAPAPPAPPRAVALDPRNGCQNLNFFAAARCEAAHCDQPAYARHPRCDAVREDRRRDEARRNPTLGT